MQEMSGDCNRLISQTSIRQLFKVSPEHTVTVDSAQRVVHKKNFCIRISSASQRNPGPLASAQVDPPFFDMSQYS